MDADIRALRRAVAERQPGAQARLNSAEKREGLPITPPAPVFDPRAWLTGYEDLPHGAFYSKDEGDYFSVVVVTDLDDACGAEGLVMVESRSCSLEGRDSFGARGEWARTFSRTHKFGKLAGALSCNGLEPGWAEEQVERSLARGTSRREIRAGLRARLAEALVSYGHADTDETLIVWDGRPSSECECEDACTCAEDGRAARSAQRRTWDGWRPDGFAKGPDGQMHADYEGEEGLTRAIESLGPSVGK